MYQGTNQLNCLNPEESSLDQHFQAHRSSSPRSDHHLNDIASDKALAFQTYGEDRGISIASAFSVFLYGTVCGSGWTLILLWLFR